MNDLSDVDRIRKVRSYLEAHGFPYGERDGPKVFFAAHGAVPSTHRQAQQNANEYSKAEKSPRIYKGISPCIVLGYAGAKKHFLVDGHIDKTYGPFRPVCKKHSIEYDSCKTHCVYGVKLDDDWVHELVFDSGEFKSWKDAVFEALRRFSKKHQTNEIPRQELINEELEQITKETDSKGATPAQTLSRVLQELRDDGTIYFGDSGLYYLLDVGVFVEAHDLPDESLGMSIKSQNLRFGDVETSDVIGATSQRKGQAKLRELTLDNYGNRCALCDVADNNLMVASRIARWSDDPDARGNLGNIILLCRIHDALFEYGYFSLDDEFALLKANNYSNTLIDAIFASTMEFRLPDVVAPMPHYLRKHRIRTGFETRS